MKVQATKKFESILDATIGKFRKKGEIFEVSEERANLLLSHGLIEKLEEEPVKEEVIEEIEKVEEPKEQKPKKTKKAKK